MKIINHINFFSSFEDQHYCESEGIKETFTQDHIVTFFTD
jgi:hypothetical protein